MFKDVIVKTVGKDRVYFTDWFKYYIGSFSCRALTLKGIRNIIKHIGLESITEVLVTFPIPELTTEKFFISRYKHTIKLVNILNEKLDDKRACFIDIFGDSYYTHPYISLYIYKSGLELGFPIVGIILSTIRQLVESETNNTQATDVYKFDKRFKIWKEYLKTPDADPWYLNHNLYGETDEGELSVERLAFASIFSHLSPIKLNYPEELETPQNLTIEEKKKIETEFYPYDSTNVINIIKEYINL